VTRADELASGRIGNLGPVPSIPEAVATTPQSSWQSRLAGVKRVAMVPAYNEAACIAAVIDEIRAVDPEMDIVVIDDGSTDATADIAARKGAEVVRLPYNLGIGGAIQTGYQYARAHGFDIAVQVDGDGQHDPVQVARLLEPILDGRADIVIGSRFAGLGAYRAELSRRLGIRMFARVVSLLVGQRLTDTSSSFRAVNRRGIRVFAADYPHGYLETVEATVLASKYGLTLAEVPVIVRRRTAGRSTLTTSLSSFYGFKVLVALFVGLFRKTYPHVKEEV
jgi:glycosyltransferase involved in cell wall biosynthesis